MKLYWFLTSELFNYNELINADDEICSLDLYKGLYQTLCQLVFSILSKDIILFNFNGADSFQMT